jgi:hypothetical protein
MLGIVDYAPGRSAFHCVPALELERLVGELDHAGGVSGLRGLISQAACFDSERRSLKCEHC